MKRLTATALLLALGTSSCSMFRARPETFEPLGLDSGLVIQDLVVPDGPRAAEGDLVTIDYEMRLADGSVADSSQEHGQPARFRVGDGQVPAGLERGIVGLPLFGRRRLTVPPELAYGDAGAPPRIPPMSTLTILVELLALESAEAKPDATP